MLNIFFCLITIPYLVDVVEHGGCGFGSPGDRGGDDMWAEVHGLHAGINLLRFPHHLHVGTVTANLWEGRGKE